MATIRESTRDDAAGIADLLNRAFAMEHEWIEEPATTPRDVLSAMASGPYFALCDDDGELIGCVHLDRLADGRGRAFHLAVEPTRQGEGHGSTLMHVAEDWACGRGLPRLVVSVLSAREDLFDFYGRRGFRATGETKELSIGIVQLAPCHLVLLDKALDAS